jgi:hypothetical protein
VESFRSKYDAWLVALVLGAVPVLWSATLTAWHDPEPAWRPVVSGVLALLATVTLLWTLIVMRYDVTGATLEIRSGPLRWSIPIASIRSVEPSREAWSSPAWSLDRLRVTATDRTMLISPRDKAGFIGALAARDAGLQRDGERLVRSARPDRDDAHDDPAGDPTAAALSFDSSRDRDRPR